MTNNPIFIFIITIAIFVKSFIVFNIVSKIVFANDIIITTIYIYIVFMHIIFTIRNIICIYPQFLHIFKTII